MNFRCVTKSYRVTFAFNLMKFIVIYGLIKVERQKVGYVHSKNDKKIPLWFIDVVATVKNLQVIPLIFTKNS